MERIFPKYQLLPDAKSLIELATQKRAESWSNHRWHNHTSMEKRIFNIYQGLCGEDAYASYIGSYVDFEVLSNGDDGGTDFSGTNVKTSGLERDSKQTNNIIIKCGVIERSERYVAVKMNFEGTELEILGWRSCEFIKKSNYTKIKNMYGDECYMFPYAELMPPETDPNRISYLNRLRSKI